MECLTYVIHAVKIKVIDSFVLICTGTDRLDLITSSLFGELTHSFMIQRKGKGFFFFYISHFTEREKRAAGSCVPALGEGNTCKGPGVLSKGRAHLHRLAPSSVLRGYHERFEDKLSAFHRIWDQCET